MKNQFKPALRYSFLNNLYDRFSLWSFKKTAFYTAITQVVKEVSPKKDHTEFNLLELGCGPGRLAIRLKTISPQCQITALDVDPKIIHLAKENASQAGVNIKFYEQDLTQLNLDSQFDRIYSTLVFHHLSEVSKKCVLTNIKNGLKPDGKFVLADFSASKGWLDRLKFLMIQLIDGFTTTAPHHLGWLEENLPIILLMLKRELKFRLFLDKYQCSFALSDFCAVTATVA